MIDARTLEAIRTIVTHDNCSDGMASAMILHDVFPSAEIVFARYDSPELRALPATEGMLFCDFSPPADRVAEFVAAGAIVLDHHKTARGVVEAFGPLGVFGDEATEPGVCGAVLAYREVWAPRRNPSAGAWLSSSDVTDIAEEGSAVRSFAELAGVRDTWQRQDPRWDEACAQAAALVFWPKKCLLEAGPTKWHDLLSIGPTLLARRAEDVAEAIRQGAHWFCGDLRIMTIASVSLTSDAMEALAGAVEAQRERAPSIPWKEADLVIGFSFTYDDEPRMIVSCRSRGLDVSTLAKKYGGGGHTRAAGFTVALSPNSPQPYELVRRMVSGWLEE